MSKDDIVFNVNAKEFNESQEPNNSFFAFGIPKNADGTLFMAIIRLKGEETGIFLSHESIDAYIYALGDLKQQLEILRKQHEDFS